MLFAWYDKAYFFTKMPWDYDKKAFQKQAKSNFRFFFERALAGAAGKVLLKKTLLKKHWKELNMPEGTRAFLDLIVWNKKF